MKTIPRWNKQPLIKDPNFKPGDSFFVEVKKEQDPLIAGKSWGIVCPNATGGNNKSLKRESPPEMQCLDTRKSWFDIGHLMALELGGSDHLSNVVPQAREQNEHGLWREWEGKLKEMAKERWEQKQQYIYFGAEAIYDSSSTDAFYERVPTQIALTVLTLSHVPVLVESMQPANAFALAKAEGALVNILHNQKRFRNELTTYDLTAVYSEITSANDNQLFCYFAGKYVEDARKSSKEQVITNALQVYFDTAGRKLSKARQEEVKAWEMAFAGPHASKSMTNEQISDALKSVAEGTGLPVPKASVPKAEFVDGFTKTGLRREESLTALGMKMKADLDRLKVCLMEAEQTYGSPGNNDQPRKKLKTGLEPTV